MTFEKNTLTYWLYALAWTEHVWMAGMLLMSLMIWEAALARNTEKAAP